MHFTGQILALDSAVVKTQKNVKFAWKLPYVCNASPQRK